MSFTEVEGYIMSERLEQDSWLDDEEQWLDDEEQDNFPYAEPSEYWRQLNETLERMQRRYLELPPKERAKREAQIRAENEKDRREWEKIHAARDEYVRAGLGEPMHHGYVGKGPYEAQIYPGGIVAVYKEAIRRGVTWEEVCGYKKPLPPWKGGPYY